MYNFLKKNKVLLVYIPLALYWIVIFVLTSLPGESFPSVGISDKLQHLLAYCVLAVLLNLTIQIQNKFALLKKYPALFTFIFIFGYAVIDEVHQLFIPGRSGELGDVIADLTGGVIGLILVKLIVLRDKNKAPRTI